jgi:heptose-I-phosphate ethanolaminephosphotransferase
MSYYSLCVSLSIYVSLILLGIMIYGRISSIDTALYTLFLLGSFYCFKGISFNKYVKIFPSMIFTSFIFISIVLVYTYINDGKIDIYLIQSGLQTNPSELVEYVGIYTLLGVLCVFIATTLILYRAVGSGGFKKDCISLLLIVFCFIFISYQQPVVYIVNTISGYYFEFSEYRRLQKQRNVTDLIQTDLVKLRGDEKYIIILGESLSKNHMSLYGYDLNTTPNLDALYQDHQIIKHPNAISSHTFSQTVLKRSLTSANQRNGKAFWQSASIMNVLSKNGFHTSWISNQTAYGPWDNLITILAEEVDVEIRMNKFVGRRVESKEFDEVLIPYVKEALKAKGPQIIFVHLIGSHAHYCSRYPEIYSEYSKSNYKSSEYNIACYDNSVKYNDFVVSEIFRLGATFTAVKGMVYMPDHSEDVLSGDRHNAAFFTYPMTEIPMLFKLSADYINENNEKMNNLSKNLDYPFVNDFLFDTVLGMVGIEGGDPRGDLFSSYYSSKDLMTTGRKVKATLDQSYLKAVNDNILE